MELGAGGMRAQPVKIWFFKAFLVRPSVPGGPAGSVRPVPGRPAGPSRLRIGIGNRTAPSKARDSRHSAAVAREKE